ncbi:hypothetical protein [Microbacterium kyungheense]|uniref:Lipoprotein n=1 Tax=Microbacterium kyungheense TaxID=1263636 RepID=A0A543EQD7_9MICO|nr:hypothetical protein [Microbacterium kyungheense]TQM23801.1 hypothetical protein FB391_3191 [Microbacterium kyungheense]
MRRVRGIGTVAAIGLLALAGCTAAPMPGPTPGPTSALPDGVTVELQQQRSDVSTRQAQVRVRNGSDEAITVAGVRVEDPRFEGAATRVIADRVTSLPAGGSVDVRVQLAPVDCDAADEADATVVLELVDGEQAAEVEVAAPDPLGFLTRLHARECLEERLTDAASLAFTGFTPSPPGEPASLELTITPTGAGSATVVGVESTNLLDFAASGDEEDLYPIDMELDEGGDADPVVIALPLVPFRCDPHAVQEDKRGTVFDVHIELDGEPGEIELFVGEELRGRMLTWVAQWCRFGG